MTEIIALLQSIAPLLSNTMLRQLSHVIFGMLVASGRITMLGLSRWTEKGGSYRSIQRFYASELTWKAVHWLFVRLKFLKPGGQYIISGDEVVASKAGKETYGLDRFFSSLQQRAIRGLAFFTFSVIDVKAARSYPLQMTQVVRSVEEKASSKAKKEAKKLRIKQRRNASEADPKAAKTKPRKKWCLIQS